MARPGSPIPFREALRVWTRIGLQSFGGPAGQIAVMHRVLVDEKKWIDEARFLHALNYCMLLPGPEAQQLATYVGWLLHGVRGGLAAGILFVLPGFVSILALSFVYAIWKDLDVVAGLFFGLKAAVLAIVAHAVVRIGKRVLKNGAMVTIAAVAFVGIFFFDLPFPLIVLGAALIGFFGHRWRPELFEVLRSHGGVAPTGSSDASSMPAHARPSVGRSLRVLGICLLLWFGPIAVFAFALGGDHVLIHEAVFFSKTALVTFGGAYAVLAYIAQQAVDHYGWLMPGEMLDGLGMVETTPGPLIQVVQFVGFMGAYRNPGTFDPLWAGVIGSVITTWVTFVPCFLWIFLGAPYVEALRGQPRLTAALSSITAAVVGIVLNLSIFFALHTLFGSVETLRAGPLSLPIPDLGTMNWPALAIAAAALFATLRLPIGIGWTLAASAAAGVLARLFLLA